VEKKRLAAIENSVTGSLSEAGGRMKQVQKEESDELQCLLQGI
jgi:hypothetical protein